MEIDYGDNDSLVHCFEGADSVVHLAGILMEGRGSDYHSANVAATVAVVRAAAAAGVGHLVFISVIGADPDSSNAYFRSKGLAEQAVLGGGIKATVIRTPILLGRGTAGAAAMAAAASRPTARLLGGGRYIMRPLDVRDLTAAILNSCDRQRSGTQEQGHGGIAQGQQQRGDGSQSVYEIVGPEAIPYHELIRRIGCMKGTDIRVGTVPIWAAKLGAAIGSRLRGGGITPTVIDVITRDETVPHNDAAALGVTLTPLTNTLRDMLK